MTQFQPTLPAEQPFSDAELAFMDESPPGLFPENQNSNFGYIIRKTFSDFIQELINQQNVIFSEHFVASSTLYLDEWERQVGLPTNPPGLSEQQRRNLVTNKLKVGPFTRARRDEIVKSFVQATLGDAVALLPSGVALTSAGVPLYSGLTSLSNAYTITENVPGFSFTISVAPGVTLDQVNLTRELNRVVPAGISFSVVTANQQFKTSGDSGTASQTVSLNVPTTPVVSDSGTASEVSILAPRSVFATDTGVGVGTGMVGYGSGVYGAGLYGGVEKITGTARISMSSVAAPTSTEEIYLRVRARKTSAVDAGVLMVTLYQGSTLIEGPYQITLGDTFATDAHRVRNASKITDWSTLEVRLQAAATNVGGNLTTQVSFIELQVTP